MRISKDFNDISEHSYETSKDFIKFLNIPRNF